MNDYYYELKHVNKDEVLTYKFPADIDIYKLEEYLKDFLRGCSWYESQLKDIFKEEE